MHVACQVSEPKDSQDTGDLPDLPTVAASEIARISHKGSQSEKSKMMIEVLHCDIIGDEFWDARPPLLAC